MADSNETSQSEEGEGRDEREEESGGPENLVGRIRNPGGGTTETDSDSVDDPVDDVAKRFRDAPDNRSDTDEGVPSLDSVDSDRIEQASSPSEEEEAGAEASAVEDDDELESFVLDALESSDDDDPLSGPNMGAVDSAADEANEDRTTDQGLSSAQRAVEEEGTAQTEVDEEASPARTTDHGDPAETVTDQDADDTHQMESPEPDTDQGRVEAEKPAAGINERAESTDDEKQAQKQSDAEEDEETGAECPECEAVNPKGMRFCVQCGAKLGDSEGTSSGIQIPAPDRRQKELSEPPEEGKVPSDLQLVAINDDGTDGEAIELKSVQTYMGRDGDQRFPTDPFLNPKHARFIVEDGKLFIEDLHSLNGTFLKLRGEVSLDPGDTFLMGRQVLQFEAIEHDIDPQKTAPDGTRYMGSPAPGGNFKILQVGVGNIVQNVYCLPEGGVVLGREKGDIIFPRDKFMSGRHARIVTEDEPKLVDLNSSNGTWIKLWEKTRLQDNDYIFMGQQLFRVSLPE